MNLMVILLIQTYGHVKQVAVAGETMNFSIIQTVQTIHMYQMEH